MAIVQFAATKIGMLFPSFDRPGSLASDLCSGYFKRRNFTAQKTRILLFVVTFLERLVLVLWIFVFEGGARYDFVRGLYSAQRTS